MALTTPILLATAAFDATVAHSFRFEAVGGDRVVKNKLIIKDNETLAEAYNQEVTSFDFVHTVPAGTLTNGKYYQATITTYNANGDASSASSPVSFYCYTAPSIVFTNIPSGNVIGSNNFLFNATYTQAEGELLNNYTFNLYDIQGLLIATSGVQYVGTTTLPPTSLSYSFTTLEDNNTYYVQIVGQTVNQTNVDTGRILITTKYEVPIVFTLIELENNCDGGYITISSQFVNITGESNPSPPTFVKENTAVDVRGNGHYVDFNQGYNLSGDFTASAWGYDFNINTTIIKMQGRNKETLEIGYYSDFDATGKVYASIKITDGDIVYYIYSDSIPTPSSEDKLQFWFRRIGNLYTIELHNLG